MYLIRKFKSLMVKRNTRNVKSSVDDMKVPHRNNNNISINLSSK